MIRSHEKQKYGNKFVHVSVEDGYIVPDFGALARAYGLSYQRLNAEGEVSKYLSGRISPTLLELEIGCEVDLNLYLPKGNALQDLMPLLSRKLYQHLDKL